MIKAIIFDFDGVLVESVDIKTNAFAKLFEPEGEDVVKRVVDYHLKNIGVSRFEKIKFIYANILKRPPGDSEFKMLCDRFANLVFEDVVNAPYVEGAKEFLERYADQYKCFIASATPQEELKTIIKRWGMMRYFKGVYGSPKKKADIVCEILAMPLNSAIGPKSFVYIGDAMSDYNAAKDNSVNFIARINNDKSIFAGIDCIKIRNLNNLKSILNGGFK